MLETVPGTAKPALAPELRGPLAVASTTFAYAHDCVDVPGVDRTGAEVSGDEGAVVPAGDDDRATAVVDAGEVVAAGAGLVGIDRAGVHRPVAPGHCAGDDPAGQRVERHEEGAAASEFDRS
jgi:hypothetical protein